ncbi:MAG: Rieske 2Fe-2S domain-containing protein [Gammaproteobacteria bacterium]
MQAFDNEWYAVGLSEEFRRGRKRGVRLHGREIVIWRRSGGQLAAIEARCPHMGASLSIGRVVDDHVECPYHGFRYDETGRCVRTPLRPAEALIPKRLCVRRFVVTERCDWVFVFWGEAEASSEPLFFDEVEAMQDKLLHSWTAKEWPVHFTRFIENTVDIAHLGSVHRNTLSWSIPDPIEVGAQVDGNRITVLPPSTTELPIVLQIIYPNMALLRLSPKFLTVFAGVPIDHARTRLYVRSSLGITRLPVVGQFVTWIKHLADMAALWQDEGAMLTVDPVSADDATGEVLMDFEPHIAEYRKLRRRKLADIEQAD